MAVEAVEVEVGAILLEEAAEVAAAITTSSLNHTTLTITITMVTTMASNKMEVEDIEVEVEATGEVAEIVEAMIITTHHHHHHNSNNKEVVILPLPEEDVPLEAAVAVAAAITTAGLIKATNPNSQTT